MPPTKKQICNGCSGSVVNPVICTTCGKTSHPGPACLSRCSHPWKSGIFIDCNEKATDTSTSPTKHDANEVLLDKIKALLDTRFNRLEDDLQSLKSSIEILYTSFTDISTRITNLEEKQKNLEMDIESNIIEELVDREARAKNLIFFNVKENGIISDLAAVKDILTVINSESCKSEVTVRRLGKNIPSKNPRPLCVTLSSSALPLTILKERNKYHGPVKMTLDQTPRQRAYLDTLRSKLQDLNDPSKTIRYIRGVPKIVSTSQSSKNAQKTH